MLSSGYTVPPDVTVSVLTAKRRPALLDQLFGPETGGSESMITLDFDTSSPRSNVDQEVHDRYKGIPWSCSIAQVGHGWHLKFRSRVFREYLATHIALLPTIGFELARRDIAMIPAAAYTSEAGTTVIAGRTGAGKTSLLLGSLGSGMKVLGDEYVGLSRHGHVSRVFRALALRRPSLRFLRNGMSHLPLSRKLSLVAAEIAASVTRRRIEPLNHVRPEELGLPVSPTESSKVSRIVWLESSPAALDVELSAMSSDTLLSRFVESAANHQALYRDISTDLELVAGDGQRRWRTTLEDGLAHASCYQLRYPPNRLGEALETLETVTVS